MDNQINFKFKIQQLPTFDGTDQQFTLQQINQIYSANNNQAF
jgi:hypothetical protein